MALYEHLRQLRQAAGLDQGGLAAATGIDQATVSRFETGKRLPTVVQLQVLARVLQTSMDALMNGTVNNPAPPLCRPDRCPYLQELTVLMQESAERLAAAAHRPCQEVQP